MPTKPTGTGEASWKTHVDIRLAALEQASDTAATAIEKAVVFATKENLDARIAALQELFDARIQAVERGITVAQTAMEKRLDGLNELRGTMNDRDKMFVTRAWVEAQIEAIRANLTDLNKVRDIATGRATQGSVYLGYAIAFISLAVAIASFLSKFIK